MEPSEVEVPIHEAFLTPIFTTPEEEHLTEKEVTLTVPTIIIIQAAAAAETTKEEEQVLEKKEDVIVVSKPLDESESDLKEISGRKPSPLSSRSPPLSSTIPPSLTGQSYSFSTENHKKALQHLYQEDINEGPLGFKTKTRSDVLIDRALSLRYGLLRPVRTDPIYAKYGLTYEDECVWFERKNIGGDEINSFFHCILAYVGRWHPMYAESNMRNGLNLRTALVDELLNMCFGIDKESVVALLVWAKSNQTVGGRDVHAVHADPAVGSTSVAIKEKRDLVADIKRKQKRSTEVLVKKFRDHCASSPFPFVNNTIVQQKQRQQQYHDVSLKKHPTLVQNGSTSVDPQQQPTLSSICYKPCEIDNPWGFLSILGDSAYKKKMANILATLWFYSEFRIISKDNYSYGTANFVLNMLEHILDLYIPEKSIDVNIMMRLYCERKGVSIFIYGIDIKNQGLRPIAKYVPTYRNASVGCNIYLIYYQGRYDLLGPVLSQTHKSQQLRYNVELRKRGTVMPHHPIPLTTTTEELLRVQTQMRGATTIVTAAIRLGSKQTKVSQEILKKAILIETDDVTLIRNEVDDVVDAGTAAHKSRPIMPTAEPAPISSSRKRIDLSCFNLDGLSFREAVMRFFSLAPKRVDVDLVADASGGDDDDDNNNDDYADDSEHVDRGEHDELSVKSSSSSMVGDLFRSAFGAKKQSPSDSKHHARIGVQNYNTNSSTVACVYDVGFDKVTVDDTTYCVYSKDRNIASLKQRMKGPFLKSSDVGRPGPFHKCSSSELSWSRSVIRIVNLGHLLDIKTQSREATSSMALNNSIHEEGESCRKDSFFLGSTFLSIKVTRNDNLQANILEPIAGFSSKLGECVEVLNDRIRSSFILVLIEELRKEFFPQQQKSSKQQQKQQKTDAGEKKENARQIDCNDRVSRIWSQFGLSKNKAAIAITPGQSDGGGGDESSAQSVDDIFYNDDRADWNEETKCHRIIHSIDSVSFKSVPCEKRTLHHLADVQTKRLSPVEALGFINRTTISYLDLNTFRVSGVGIMDDKRYSASSRNPFLRYHSTTWQNPFEGSANHQRGAHVNSIFPSFYGTFDALSSDGVGGSSSHLRLSQSQQKFNINLSFHLPKCCSGVVIYSRTPIIQMDARRKSTVAYRTVQSQYNHQKQHSAARDVPSAEMLAHLMCLNERREKDQDELWKLTLGQYLRQRKTGGSTDAASAIKIVGYKESGSIEALLATVEASPIEMNSLFDLQDPQSFRLVGYIYVLVTYDVDPIMYSTLLDTQSATRATSANASGSSNSLNVNDVCRHVNVKTKSFYANCIKAFNS